MGTVNGTTSQHGSKYDFYMVYETSFDATKMKHTVKVSSHLRVKKWRYIGTTSHNLTIGGVSVDKDSGYKKTCGDNTSTKVYKIASGSKTYPASSSARDIKLKASMSADSGGYGPGNCSVSKTITLKARLSAKGKLTVSNVTSHSIRLDVSELPTGVGYTRTCTFYYKRSNTTNWTKAGVLKIASDKSSDSLAINDTFLPGVTYDFKCSIAAPDGTIMCTPTAKGTTQKDTFSLVIEKAGVDEVQLRVTGLVGVAGSARTLKAYRRVKGASNWTSVATISYGAKDDVGAPKLSFPNLQKGTTYEFLVEMYYGTYFSYSATTLATANTANREDYTIGDIVIDESSITIPITNNTIDCNSNVAYAYIKGNELPYCYLGRQNGDFTKGESFVLQFDISNNETFKQLTEVSSLKIIFGITNFQVSWSKIEDILQIEL